jgi:hypothetical protein
MSRATSVATIHDQLLNDRRHTHRSLSRRDIYKYDRISTDTGVIANMDGTEDLGASTDIHMSTNAWHAAVSRADSDLLEDQTVRSDAYISVNDYAIRMREQQSFANPGADRNIGTRNDAPEPMPQDRQLSQEREQSVLLHRVRLIIADA